MPAIYAHNKYGKKVLAGLPANLKDLIRKYPNSFRQGLQGPDSIFFYRPFYKNKVNQYGVRMHKEDAYPFFEDAVSIVSAAGLDSATHAYLLGFICHFTLDNYCHPFVNSSMDDTGCGHIEIEGDFDNYLLTLDGFIPESYPLDKLVPTDSETALSMAPFYPEVTLEQIETSLRHMKTTKRFFVASNPIKRSFIDTLMHVNYKMLKGHMIYPSPNSNCRHCSEHLYEMLLEAVPMAHKRIATFEDALVNDIELTDDFHGNFNGN